MTLPSTSELRPILDSAMTAARAAGAIQRARIGAVFVVEDKGAADITTDVDRECEAAIVAHVRRAHPDHAVLAEEGTSEGDGARWMWIVDPLDGTKNYAHGYPRSCVSIAVALDGQAVVGVVYNPHTDELFSAVAGGGAHMNGTPIEVSATSRLGRAMVASALTYDTVIADRERRADRLQMERLTRVFAAAEAVRSDGCCALDLCDVARGRFDAYFERGLKAWDTAAGTLIVREAGGRTSTFNGNPHDPFGLDTVATNGRIHDELLALLPP